MHRTHRVVEGTGAADEVAPEGGEEVDMVAMATTSNSSSRRGTKVVASQDLIIGRRS